MPPATPTIAASKPTEIFIDFDALPAELDEAQYEELVATLPPYKKRTKPKPVEHSDLQALTIAEMHELSEKEKIPDFSGRNRREAIWQITQHRLRSHTPVIAVHDVVAAAPALTDPAIFPNRWRRAAAITSSLVSK